MVRRIDSEILAAQNILAADAALTPTRRAAIADSYGRLIQLLAEADTLMNAAERQDMVDMLFDDASRA